MTQKHSTYECPTYEHCRQDQSHVPERVLGPTQPF